MDGRRELEPAVAAFLSKLIRIVVDCVQKGEDHGKIVAHAIAPNVRDLRIIHLPGLPPKGDLWDWTEAGGTREQLKNIVEYTPAPYEAQNGRPEAPRADNPHSLLRNSATIGNAERLILKFGDRRSYCPTFGSGSCGGYRCGP
jgi:hypothetical protein